MSVIVATRDRPEELAGLLRSLARQTLAAGRFEAVVVDDGSSGSAARAVAEAADNAEFEVRTVRREASGGPARARNEGWRASRGRLVAFTDDDCVATPEWLEAGVAAAGQRSDVVVQGSVLPMPDQVGMQGPFTRTHRIEPPTPWFETGSIFYPRRLLDRLGGFDESFPEAAGEDTDLGWRALELGAERVAAAEAIVFHPVDRLGPRGKLRLALRGADAVLAFKRHPRLRSEALRHRFFWKESHALVALSAAGLLLSRRHRFAAVLAVPYAVDLVRRTRANHATPALAPYLMLTDLLETYTAIRGSIRHRVLLL